MAEFPIPLLRRYEDPETSSDPRVRELVGQLATLQVAPRPRPAFRDELRAQLVAITPRIVAETAAEEKQAAAKATTVAAPARVKDRRRVSLGRPLLVAATLVTVLAIVLGGAVWMSRKALPGDALYGLKRTSERVELAFDSNDTERAQDYLKFAGTRVDEAHALLGRADASGLGPQAAGVSSHTAGLIDSTLASSDSDVRKASSLLGNQAVRSGSPAALSTLISWAPSQLARLNSLDAALPAGPLRNRSVASTNVVRTALTRAQQLQTAVAAHRTTAPNDPFGPTPCNTCGTATTTPQTGTGPGGVVPGKGGASSTSTRGGTTPKGGTGGSSTSTTPGGSLPTLPVQLPTSLPAKLPSVPVKLPTSLHVNLPTKLPVAVNSSCVSASVVIGIHVGNC